MCHIFRPLFQSVLLPHYELTATLRPCCPTLEVSFETLLNVH